MLFLQHKCLVTVKMHWNVLGIGEYSDPALVGDFSNTRHVRKITNSNILESLETLMILARCDAKLNMSMKTDPPYIFPSVIL